MRTTLNLEEDALEEITAYAKQQNISKGAATSFLVKQAVELMKPRIGEKDGLPCIIRPPGTPKYSMEELQKIIDENPWL